MDAAGVRCLKHRAKRWPRTAKSCGPGAATLASSRVVSPTPATVAKEAAHRGEHEAVVKTIRAGKAGMSRLNL